MGSEVCLQLHIPLTSSLETLQTLEETPIMLPFKGNQQEEKVYAGICHCQKVVVSSKVQLWRAEYAGGDGQSKRLMELASRQQR
jgi:hypothetical protein